MRWQIEHWTFVEDRRCLQRGSHEQVLEPRQAEVLAYFCAHPGRVISRDELVDAVWERSAVTDSAVNRIIAKLRKALGDDARQGAFIVTLPRKGYRFVATVNALPQDQSVTAPGSVRKSAIVFVALVAVGTLLLAVLRQPDDTPRRYGKLTSLTRGSGLEYLPAISPDGRFLTYSTDAPNGLDLYLKNLQTDEVRLLSDQIGSAGNGDWSRDGKRFLYLYALPDRCEIRVIEFDDAMAVSDKRTIHRCPPGSYGNFAFGHDGKHIIYSEVPEPTGAYQIFVKNLEDGTVHMPRQPPLHLAGNREFDLHPTENKLLVASPNQEQLLAFHVVNLDANTSTVLYAIDDFVCCPIFDASGDQLLMAGPLPTLSIVAMGLDDPAMTTVFETSHRVHRLRRVPNSSDLVYSGGLSNLDVAYHDFTDGSQSMIFDSTVLDHLPAVSNDQRSVAFVSERSGFPALWLHDRASGESRRLTDADWIEAVHDLKWSPDDASIAVLTFNGVEIVDAGTGEKQRLAIAAQQIRGISWVDEQTVAMSLLVDASSQPEGLFRVYHYDVASATLKRAETEYAYQYHGPEVIISIDDEGVAWRAQKRIDIGVAVSFDRRFRFEVRGQSLYFARGGAGQRVGVLMRWNLADGTLTELVDATDALEFSVADSGVYLTRVVERRADIFRVGL